MPSIRFFEEDVAFTIPHPRKTSAWIKSAIVKERKTLGEVNYIFCSDEYLRQVNIQYLNHHTFTDIVTFDSSEVKGQISGDIFISIDRVKENAEKFKTTFDHELHRVLIHGVLHLIGYTDKGLEKKAAMRKKEDAYLSLRK